MSKITDARKLKHESLTDLRMRGVQSIQNGNSPYEVARNFGVVLATVYNWLSLYRSGGWDALRANKRGGRYRLINAKQLKWIYDTITGKNPMQLKFPFALWTAVIIGELIYKKFGIKLSKASVCRLLGQLGITPQRPIWKAYQQKPEMVKNWLAKEYPEIRKLANKIGAKVFFGDEAGVRSDHHSGKTWGKKGKTPIVMTTGARFGLNIISCVSAQGEFRFMTFNGKFNAKMFLEFLKRLIAGSKSMIFLIVDGHPTHKAKIVNKFLDNNKDKIRLFFLPPYSPELNPDEPVWNDLKNNKIGRMKIEGPEVLKKSVLKFLHFLSKTPERVKGYFNNATTKYAADY